MFSTAIVRRPARSMARGITSNPALGAPDHAKALVQHEAYEAALRKCGLAVTVLPALEDYPDSCFVEDVAVCASSFAMVTAPGAASRAGETAGIEELLRRHFKEVERVAAPGTLEGGDVMRVGDTFYIGLSARTNREGARQLVAALERRGMAGKIVAMSEFLHLKTGIVYLEDGVFLAAGEFLRSPEFQGFRRIEIDSEEAYAANCIRVNDHVLVPAGFPRTAAAVRGAGFSVIEVDTSEYRKLDGGLSCLSLRF